MNDIGVAGTAGKPAVLQSGRVRYEIHDHTTIAIPKDQSGVLDIWSPVIPDTPYQRVLDIAVDAPRPWQVVHEPEFGSPIFHTRIALPGYAAVETRFDYVVERLPVVHDRDPRPVSPILTPALFSRVLGEERFVAVNDKTRALARDVAGGERNPVMQARLLYDHVTATMAYDAARQSWKGSTEHALACSVGNCNDIHALFISLTRSLGIPARLVLSQALEAPPPGAEACELCGYHCWAEFFAPGLGWIPVDASCACKYGKDALFGALESNHVAWSVGRDILLIPPQRGPRILFFAGPYAELDGQPHSGVERRITFAAAR
jgi:transglutaminase-like putative cysteine protease